jgi:HEAT repeat protein
LKSLSPGKEVLTEGERKRTIEEWINRFESDHHHVRRKAIEALGDIDDDRATELLVKALNDEDAFVRRIAVRGLGKRGAVGLGRRHLITAKVLI